jgi:hypothetical protein
MRVTIWRFSFSHPNERLTPPNLEFLNPPELEQLGEEG